MALTVKHAHVSAIADDPGKDVSSGEWNADHPVTGALDAVNGGTGQTSYAVGDLLYASSASALSKLADIATGNALISGGVGVAPSWGKISLAGAAGHISGQLPVVNGGNGNGSGISGATQTALDAKQALDADLTALAALTGTDTIYYRSAASTWTAVTMGANMTFSSGVLNSTASGGGGSSLTIGETPPGSPAAGAMWWESDSGQLYIYYNDGNTSQWASVGTTGVHTHVVADVTGLQAALDAKAKLATISTLAPSGGVDGDVWYQVV